MGWLSLLGFLCGAWGIYLSYISNRQPKPVFSIVSDDVLVDSQPTNKIKVYFDSVPVKNVRIAKIAVWNAGNGFLNKGDIVKNTFLIKSKIPVRILEAKQNKSTRNDLKIQTTIHKIDNQKENYDFTECHILGDEGFEAGDGVIINILYTSKKQGNWILPARIKGTPTGFTTIKGVRKTYGDLAFAMLSILAPLIVAIEVMQKIKKWGTGSFFRRESKWNLFFYFSMTAFFVFCMYSSYVIIYDLFILEKLPNSLEP